MNIDELIDKAETVSRDDVAAAIARTLATLERLSALERAIIEQDHHRVRNLMGDLAVARRLEREGARR